MPTAAQVLKLDLDDDGVYEIDISSDVLLDRAIAMSGLGRKKELEGAGQGAMVVRLKNRTADFSPKNASSPHFPDLEPLKGIQLQMTYNAVTYDLFTGVILAIEVRPMPLEQEAFLTCADRMYVLAHTDTKLPLMENHLTGIIINRLLDYAEEGELLSNDRFKDDLTSWTLIGSATQTRVITGVLLHQPAAMDVTAPAIGDGVRHDFTAATSLIITGATYVWAEDDGANEGKDVDILIQDDAGNTTETLTLTAVPQRIAAKRTIGGANPRISISRPTANGATAWRVGAAHVVLDVAALDRSAIDLGQSRLERIRFHRVPAARAIEQVRDNELGGLFFFDGSGKPTFHDQAHRWRETEGRVSQATFNESFQGLPYSDHAADRPSEVILDFPRWIEGTPGAQVWASDRVPIAIKPNGSVTIEADFGGGLIRNAIVPVANTDWEANAAGDGGGADESGNLTLDFTSFGGGASFKFTSSVARTIYVTKNVLRATAVLLASDRSPARATPTTPPKLINVLRHTFKHNASEPKIQAWADYIAERYGDTQRERLGMDLLAPFPEAETSTHMTEMLARKIGDRITISNDDDAHTAKLTALDYYIDGITRTLDGSRLITDWRLSPADKSYMIWDTSSWGGPEEWAP